MNIWQNYGDEDNNNEKHNSDEDKQNRQDRSWHPRIATVEEIDGLSELSNQFQQTTRKYLQRNKGKIRIKAPTLKKSH